MSEREEEREEIGHCHLHESSSDGWMFLVCVAYLVAMCGYPFSYDMVAYRYR